MRYLVVGLFVACGSSAPVTAPPPQAPVVKAEPAKPVHATDASSKKAELEALLAFEAPAGDLPKPWTALPEHTMTIDSQIVHGGQGAIKIERTATTARPFSMAATHFPIDFAGETVKVHGFLRTADVKGSAGFWIREDNAGGTVQFVNMESAKLEGTADWKEYSLELPLDPNAEQLIVGVLLVGTGTMWADDLHVEIDGKPIWDAPYVEKQKEPVDHSFDHGSGITVTQLSPIQIENLAAAGKVWGFLKYHHPKVTTGKLFWDSELLKQLPAILAATDRASGDAVLVKWIDGLGPVAPCNPCAKLDEKDLGVKPDHAWFATLGSDLRARLEAIDAARVPGQQHYVEMAPGVQNPVFHEPTTPALHYPDPGFQFLGLARLWNIVEYWAPNRALADHWDTALQQLIPRVMLAANEHDYKQGMMAAIARIRDSHANLWSSLEVRPPEGECRLDVEIRFVDKHAVVVGSLGALKPGDVITTIDGVTVDTLIKQWAPLYASSNESAQLRDMAENLTKGPCTDIALGVGGKQIKLPRTADKRTEPGWHDLPGPAFRMLSADVAYLKLSNVKADDVPAEAEQAAHTKGWIIDIRNYPSEFMPFVLGPLLVTKTTPFARFTKGDLSNPGAFSWRDGDPIEPATTHYAGKVVVLVDEVSQSQAEYTTMAFRAAHAIVVGSQTAGADGNVSMFPMPGGLTSMISGLGVFYPDGKPTQQIGIVPDVVVKPTIAGIRAGRDEVLEAGIREILGAKANAQQIVRDARK
ncbi:MAG: S41 family peptidase [Kofleriaceae bacterium]